MLTQSYALVKQRPRGWFYGLVILLALVVYALLVVGREGWAVWAAPANTVELAILAPLSGPQAEAGRAVLLAARQAVRARPAYLRLGDLDVRVVGYDTRGTSEGAAEAAARAGCKPSVAAIIGPLEASQVASAAKALRGYDLAMITPASLPLTAWPDQPGVYSIPATDSSQGQTMADFLEHGLHRTEVFLVSDFTDDASRAAVQDVLDEFSQAAWGHVSLVGELDMGGDPSAGDFVRRVVHSKATVVLYLGGAQGARTVLQFLNSAGLQLPLVGVAALGQAARLSSPGNVAPVYYTDAVLSLPAAGQGGGLPVYFQALGEAANTPLAYETTQAAWLVLDALSAHGALATPWGPLAARRAVWHRLPKASVPGLEGDLSFGTERQLSHTGYVYQLTPPDLGQAGTREPTGWQSRLVHVASLADR